MDYIIKSTVGKLVKHKTPKQVAALHILDPACGSGSFLIDAYQFLLDWHVEWYIKDGAEKYVAGKKPALYKSQTGDWKLTTAERKRILLNNIYGVDIDSQAVEVTKLSLLLKVLEGENEQTISSQLKLFHERALPDLGNNIKCGNSLIGSDFYQDKQLRLFPDEEKYRINMFDWDGEHGFKEIMKKGGFDAVVGNPPYGALLTEDETNYLNSTFVMQNYQLDTYLLFIEKSLRIINRGALLGFIIPNTWLQNLQTNKFREYIFNHTSIEEIIHFLFKVFAKATVDTEIVILKKSKPSSEHDIKISIADKSTEPPKKHVIKQERWKSGNGAPVNIFEKNEYSTLIGKLTKYPVLDDLLVVKVGTKPFQVGKGKPPQTRKIVNEKPYVSENKANSTFRPLLRGSLVQKYVITWRNNYWISFGDWLAEPRYSANYDAPEKIVIRRTGDSLVATLDAQQFIVQNSLWTIIGRRDNINLKYCLGLLNSKLLNWIHQTVINPEKGEALAEVKRGHLAKLPIALIDAADFKNKSRHDHIVSLVEQMLELNKQLPKAKTEQDKTVIQRQIEGTDTEIDKLVYELYGLTDAEIKVVEG